MRRIGLIFLGRRNGKFFLLEEMSYVNVLGAFYQRLHMGGKDTIFGGKLKNMLVRRHEQNYTEIFVVIHIL